MLSFPCKILGALPLLSATDTPDELNVIHSIAAEPPNSGTDRRGALMESQIINNGKHCSQFNHYSGMWSNDPYMHSWSVFQFL